MFSPLRLFLVCVSAAVGSPEVLAACAGPLANALPSVPTVLVRGVLVDAQGAPLGGRVLHVGPLDGRQAVVELRDHEILNPTATTDARGRFSVVVPVAFFAAAARFTVGAAMAERGVPSGAARLPLVPVERNGEAASFGYRARREAVELGEVQLPSGGD